MYSIVRHCYDVDLMPDESDESYSVPFRMTVEKHNSETVMFTVCSQIMDDYPKYIGRLPQGGIWYIDPSFYRGMTITPPLSFSKFAERLEGIDEYDETICWIVAKAIELITADILGIALIEEELPF